MLVLKFTAISNKVGVVKGLIGNGITGLINTAHLISVYFLYSYDFQSWALLFINLLRQKFQLFISGLFVYRFLNTFLFSFLEAKCK